MRLGKRRIGSWLGAALLLLSLLRAQAAAQTKPDLREQYARGPHTGTAEEALVGVEVTAYSTDGKYQQTRYGNGLILRCDGFILVPNSLFSRTIRVDGSPQQGGSQRVRIVVRPGTPQETQHTAKPPRFLSRRGYSVLKVQDFFSPAALTMLPDTLKPGDRVRVLAVSWNAEARRYLPPIRQEVRLASAETAEAGAALSVHSGEGDAPKARSGLLAFDKPLENIPAGAVVVGEEGRVVGMVVETEPGKKSGEFVSFAVLNEVTNCVAPVPTPDRDFQGRSEEEMITVPGGPVWLPRSILAGQPDMEDSSLACVASFQIDRYEVTNEQYYAFWRSLPESVRMRSVLQYYPLGWNRAPGAPPFSPEVARLPVLGVPLWGAIAYAHSRGKRLLTPYEWLRAAFGEDSEPSIPWAGLYLQSRYQAWSAIVRLHEEYLRAHPELHQPAADFVPASNYLPWLVQGPFAVLVASGWSKETLERVGSEIRRAWADPLKILPVGSREFDRSPYDVQDMILNAAEMVLPCPGPTFKGEVWSVDILWTPYPFNLNELYRPQPIGLLLDGHSPLPPISRLLNRTLISGLLPEEDILAWTNLSEALQLLLPYAGWQVGLHRSYRMDVDTVPPSPGGYANLTQPAGLRPWREAPSHLRAETGYPPLAGLKQILRSDGRSKLYYLLPVGFRCAR